MFWFLFVSRRNVQGKSRPLVKGVLSAQKALLGNKTEKNKLLGGTEGNSGSTRYFIPVKIENSTCDIFLLLSALSSCVVCVFEPKYKSAAAAYVLLFLRNVTCASHAPYNIYTT